MLWGNDPPSSGPWVNKLPAVHTDLIVAATNQFSGTSLGGHESGAYCDKFFVDQTTTTDSKVFKTKGPFTSGNKCTYVYTLSAASGTTHAPGFKLSSVGDSNGSPSWMNFQLHFIEWSETACATSTSCIMKLQGNSNVSPKYFGDYTNSGLFLPSPLKYTCTTAGCEWNGSSVGTLPVTQYNQASGVSNKAWDGANMNTFEDISNIVPGSIGPIGYYTNSTGPW